MQIRTKSAGGLGRLLLANLERAIQIPGLVGWILCLAFAESATGSENVPHRPFAQWADVPLAGQFVVGVVYEESESYHMWANNQYHNITYHANDGESYGIDINQGYLALQYGITERWAADLNIGYTSMGWRFFDNGTVQSTSGLMDFAFGVRY